MTHIRLYVVKTTKGTIELYSPTKAQAITTATELTGPDSKVIRISKQGEW